MQILLSQSNDIYRIFFPHLSADLQATLTEMDCRLAVFSAQYRESGSCSSEGIAKRTLPKKWCPPRKNQNSRPPARSRAAQKPAASRVECQLLGKLYTLREREARNTAAGGRDFGSHYSRRTLHGNLRNTDLFLGFKAPFVKVSY